jgi:hypothetical protein
VVIQDVKNSIGRKKEESGKKQSMNEKSMKEGISSHII